VAARVVDGQLIVGHAGDSRLYVFSADVLHRITDDDSWMATMLANDPAADPVALQHHPMRHALTNAVGSRARTDAHVVEQTLAIGDTLLLTTDGVHGVLEDQRLTLMLRRGGPPRTIAERIVSAALARGSRDNVTAVVARYT
jgi:PPM family protein phosphatase